MVTATAIFNGNAFPDHFQREVDVSANRFALFLHNTTLIGPAIQKDLSEFIGMLGAHATDLELASKSRSDLRIVAYFDGLAHLMTFHSILYSLKAFLDVFARLTCKLINPATKPITFGSKQLEGRAVSGGKLAKWIEGSSPDSFSNKLPLRDVILTHSRNWISEAVVYRDTLAHYQEIQGMDRMHVPIYAVNAPYAPEHVRLPRLPNGKLLDAYSSELMGRLGTFLDDAIFLLPNIKPEMIEPWQRSQRYLNQ